MKSFIQYLKEVFTFKSNNSFVWDGGKLHIAEKSFRSVLFENLLKTKKDNIVSVQTEDGVSLEGVFYENGGNTAIAHTHGTASFYGNEVFEPSLLNYCNQKGYSFLSFNNRGAKISGASTELFSDCPKDIDAWINFLSEKGYQNIILSGHSLGTEKIAHYMRNVSRPLISSMIFLAPSDTIGNQQRYENSIGGDFFLEAKKLVSSGNPDNLLSNSKAHAGVLPMSAAAYLDFYSPGKPLENALSFRKNRILPFPVPVIAYVPTNDHYNITSPLAYQECLERIGVDVVVCETDHDFNKFDLNFLIQDKRIRHRNR